MDNTFLQMVSLIVSLSNQIQALQQKLALKGVGPEGGVVQGNDQQQPD
jgi:hypothetical protein